MNMLENTMKIIFANTNRIVSDGVFCEGKNLFTFNEAHKPETEIECSDIDELLDVDVQGVSLSEIITEVEVTWRNI